MNIKVRISPEQNRGQYKMKAKMRSEWNSGQSRKFPIVSKMQN